MTSSHITHCVWSYTLFFEVLLELVVAELVDVVVEDVHAEEVLVLVACAVEVVVELDVPELVDVLAEATDAVSCLLWCLSRFW